MNIKVIFLSVVLVTMLVAAGAAGFYAGTKYRLVPVSPTSASSPIITLAPTSMVTNSPTPIPTPDAAESAAIAAAVRQGLIAEHGPDGVDIHVTVAKVSGNFAQGSASATAGGAMWFAAKVKSTWVLVWDGNGTVSCNSVAPYPDFPTSMIPECWNDTLQKMITR